jgi:hypothetical protein
MPGDLTGAERRQPAPTVPSESIAKFPGDKAKFAKQMFVQSNGKRRWTSSKESQNRDGVYGKPERNLRAKLANANEKIKGI